MPNVGGFAGLSVKYAAAKVSFGYRADFFFGAMDGGIDVRRTEDFGFHGPTHQSASVWVDESEGWKKWDCAHIRLGIFVIYS